jgi:hypothetical protein
MIGRAVDPCRWNYSLARFMKSTCRLPQREHASSSRQPSTGVSAPYRAAISAGSGLDLMAAFPDQTINRTPAAAAPPGVIGGPGSDFMMTTRRRLP